jgi:hypothetical protein
LPEDFGEYDEKIGIDFQPKFIQKIVKIGEVRSLEMNLYEVNHHSENDPRISLSRDSFRLLAHYGVKRALILFISENSLNYRLSLVTIDLKWEEGKRVKREYSNPRRYSFFLGPETKTHTLETYLIKKGRVKDFDDLKERFSLEIVNKDFYTQIAILFTKLAGGERTIGRTQFDEKGSLYLPSTTDDKIKKEFSVRLIGRLVFCWFLKKKCSDKGTPLLPEELLSSKAVIRKSDFYHNILEPLFFETLNTQIKERKKEYQLPPWAQIPFLNGGLFANEYNDYYEIDQLGISKYINTLKVPDNWLKELFEIFEIYNFTIDENTSVDVELSIEPEMLGRIFENLLAEINPETGNTARKSTGSYYTPRPIVEYMVDESLKQYLLTKTNIDERKISSLLAYEEEEIGLSESEKDAVIDALDVIKIIDPACGSGAFPMGILQKMLLILQKIDPESKKWLNKKVSQIENTIVREEFQKKIEAENWNYVHKLDIIQNSIYGVDIQPIAVDISKLRFFLSLIVDEKVDDSKENRGIDSLPNLEFKFVCANSLIGLPITLVGSYKKKLQPKLFEAVDNITELKKLREEYLRCVGNEKKLIEKKFQEIQSEMFLNSLNWGGEDSQTVKLSQWNPFSGEPCAWFDPEWMFGIKDGFDVVIANPPYGNLLEKKQKEVMKSSYFHSTFSDISSTFIEESVNFLKNRGHLVFIITFAITFSKEFSKSRELIFNSFEIALISSFDRDRCKIFKSMSQSVSIMRCFNKNSNNKKGIFSSRFFRDTPEIDKIMFSNCNNFLLSKNTKYNQKHRLPKLGEKINQLIITKLLSYGENSTKIIKNNGDKIWIRTSGNYWYNAFDRQPYKSSEIKPLFILSKYNDFTILFINSSLFYFWFRIYGDGRHMNIDILENFPLPSKEKVQKYNILLRKVRIKFMDSLFSVFEKDRNRFLTSEIKCEIDLLDLILGKYFYSLSYDEIKHILNYDSEIRRGIKLQKPFIDLINQILSLNQSEDYLQNPIKQAKVKEYEKQIDQMVYKLYGLTDDEIKIIENFHKKA